MESRKHWWYSLKKFIFLVMMIISVIGISAGCGSAGDKENRGVLPRDNGEIDVKEDVGNEVNEISLAGMYLSDNGSIIVLHATGMADYYKYENEDLSTDNEWEYNDGKITIDLSSIHCKVSGEVVDSGRIVLESDSALWENATYDRFSDEKENISVSECKNVIEERLGLGESLDYVEIEYDGIEYNMPSYLSFWAEEDDIIVYASQDKEYLVCMCSGYAGTTVSSQALRELLVNNMGLQSGGNEGEIKVAGYQAYYLEIHDNQVGEVLEMGDVGEKYDNGVIVVIQHDGNFDMLVCAEQTGNDERDYLADIYNMLGTAVKAGGDSTGTGSSAAEGNTTENANDLYTITNVYFYPFINSIGYPEYYAVVEIENTSNSNLRLKDCVFELEDNEGHLLYTEDYISACPSIIQPGEKGYFYNNGVTSMIINGIDTSNGAVLCPSITVEKTNAVLTYYDIVDRSVSSGITGLPEFVGRVTNNTSASADRVKVYGLMADDDGQVIGIAYTNVDDLGSGQTKSFSISTLQSVTPEAKNASQFLVFATNESLGW